MRERASSALSMPVALRAVAVLLEEGQSSSWPRSRPRVFLGAVLAFAPLGLVGREASSSARRRAFSAFFAAASSAFAAASSLCVGGLGQVTASEGRERAGRVRSTSSYSTWRPWTTPSLPALLASRSTRRLWRRRPLVSVPSVSLLLPSKSRLDSAGRPSRFRPPSSCSLSWAP